MYGYTDITEAAKDAVGNWERYPDFGWYDAPDPEKWTLVNLSNRDSGVIEESNRSVIESEMKQFGEDCETGRSSHWAVGWVDNLVVRVYDDDGNITPAFEKIHELLCTLDDYPILDEDDVSDREWKDAMDTWDAWAYKELIGSLKDGSDDAVDDVLGQDGMLEIYLQLYDGEIEHDNEGARFASIDAMQEDGYLNGVAQLCFDDIDGTVCCGEMHNRLKRFTAIEQTPSIRTHLRLPLGEVQHEINFLQGYLDAAGIVKAS